MSLARRRAEWLEADGLGGFASGTIDGIRTRRYHALLLAATTPPTGRLVLVNGMEAWVETPDGREAITSQLYAGGPGDVVHPDGARRLESFEPEPWPRWRFRLASGALLEQEIFARRGMPVVALRWRLVNGSTGVTPRRTTLCVRLLLSGRDYHALHHENGAFRFDPDRDGDRLIWRPYAGVPPITVRTHASYLHDPTWYRRFVYEEERSRGLDCIEDLASPGVFRFELGGDDAVLILSASQPESETRLRGDATTLAASLRSQELERREGFPSRLHRAADAYLVQRGGGRTVIAGYPWFTDWGRDTFIALRGLCLATGRIDEARDILLEWAGAVSEGMLPNRFADRGESPEYNAVDASLWYVVAVHETLQAFEAAGRALPSGERAHLHDAVGAILSGYAAGTRFGIRMDEDGLLRAGQPGWQLTWMDAKVGDWVVTPRIGKPVEVEALWVNALWIGSQFDARWRRPFARARESFGRRFWNETAGCLYDVVDVDHVPGKLDASCRPNQIFAVGGLPLPLLDGARARRIVDAVESRLATPLGLRSLAPDEPGYVPHYEGDPRARDGAYHQGTVWPWLAGAFVEAWVRVRGATSEARAEARARFIAPLLAHLDDAGLGHVSEIADADAPHTSRGCPFQAWSLGELLRLLSWIAPRPAASAPDPRSSGLHGSRATSRAGST